MKCEIEESIAKEQGIIRQIQELTKGMMWEELNKLQHEVHGYIGADCIFGSETRPIWGGPDRKTV